MSTTRIGKLPPRYSFFLNPYTDIRFSKGPLCEKPTAMRKFALVIYLINVTSLCWVRPAATAPDVN